MVPHHSTDSAINCLTAQIGRDAVGLVVYGRNSKANEICILKYRPPISEGLLHTWREKGERKISFKFRPCQKKKKKIKKKKKKKKRAGGRNQAALRKEIFSFFWHQKNTGQQKPFFFFFF